MILESKWDQRTHVVYRRLMGGTGDWKAFTHKIWLQEDSLVSSLIFGLHFWEKKLEYLLESRILK